MMNTRIVMILSSVFLGVLGILLTFLPHEILSGWQIESSTILVLAFQLFGAMYLGLAMNNWMAKGARIGGIYNRPLAVGNFTHFMIGGIASIKVVTQHTGLPWSIFIIAGGYVLLTILFGILLFRSPIVESEVQA